MSEYFPEEVVSGKGREKWAKVSHYDMMSSEESSEEAEGQKDCIIVKILPWRSSRLNKFMESWDERVKDEKSNQSLRQMKQRLILFLNLQVIPSHFPSWAFN